MNEQQILDVLTNSNIPAIISGYEDDMVDGEVSILGTHLRIQVGSMTGFELSESLFENPYDTEQLTGVRYYPDTENDIHALIAKIKEMRQ